mgnify:CR=1 FL=1
MKHHREFEIAFVGLKPGEHEYRFQIDDTFFDNLFQEGKIEKPEFHNSFVEVRMVLDKKSGTMLLRFFISGKATIPCDRCGDDFEITLWDEFELLVKTVDDDLVEKSNQEDAEVAYIGRSESLLDVSMWLFEFVTLCIPIQHVHGEDEHGNSLCNAEVLKYLLNQPLEGNNSLQEQLKKNNLS